MHCNRKNTLGVGCTLEQKQYHIRMSEVTRQFRFKVEWLINDDWEPREVEISLPARDCSTEEQISEMEGTLGEGLAFYYGTLAGDPEGFSVTLIPGFPSMSGAGDDE